MSVDDVVSTALRIGEFILSNSNISSPEEGKKNQGGEKGETTADEEKSSVPALVRRAKDFPMLASELSLSSALIFFISKAESQDVLFDSYQVFHSVFENGLKNGKVTDVKEEIVNDVINSALKTDEGAGYDVYAGLTLALIGTKFDSNFNSGITEKTSSKDFLLYALKELRKTEEDGKGFELQRRLMPYLIEIKRVMEVVGVAYK